MVHFTCLDKLKDFGFYTYLSSPNFPKNIVAEKKDHCQFNFSVNVHTVHKSQVGRDVWPKLYSFKCYVDDDSRRDVRDS